MNRSPPASEDRARSGSWPSPHNPTTPPAQNMRARRDGSKACRLPAAKPVLRHEQSGRGRNDVTSPLEAVEGDRDRCP
jgi:hypothetical protein